MKTTMTIDKKSKGNPLTESAVWNAIEHLIARGERPTEASIREYLGNTGSYTTIRRLLSAWFEEVGSKLVDKNLPKESEADRKLREAMAVVMKLTREVVKAEFASTREQLEDEQKACAAERKSIASERASYQHRIGSLEQQVVAQTSLRESLESQNAALRQGEHVSTERISSLEATLQHANIEAARLKSELDAAKTALHQARQEAATAQRLLTELKEAQTSLQLRLERAESTHATAASQVKTLTDEVALLRDGHNKSEQARLECERQLALAHAKTADLSALLADQERAHQIEVNLHAKALADERARIDRQIELLARSKEPGRKPGFPGKRRR